MGVSSGDLQRDLQAAMPLTLALQRHAGIWYLNTISLQLASNVRRTIGISNKDAIAFIEVTHTHLHCLFNISCYVTLRT